MPNLKSDYSKNDTFLRRWGGLLILLVFFMGSWFGQYKNQLHTFKQDAEEHNQQAQMNEFWPEFWSSTLENWQSEWLQLFTQGLIISGFSTYLFRKQNEEHYKTQMMLEDLNKRIEDKDK